MGKRFGIPESLVWSSLLVFLMACGDALPAEEEFASALSRETPKWTPLGGDLNPNPAAFLSKPSLASSPRSQPVLGFSVSDPNTYRDQTLVSQWNGSSWEAFGQPLAEAGPSVAVDSQRRIYACTGSGGPFVRRWNGSSFIALGGNISDETGYMSFRYNVESCGGIVVDSSDTPIIVWSADVGAKANVVYAARWNKDRQKWEGLGADSIGGRATSGNIDIDAQDRLYVATYAPGGSYGGGATTRVWRWNGSAWNQLGEDMPNTINPVIAVRENTIYLSLGDNAKNVVNVLRWRQGDWVGLPSPGSGDVSALAFTLSGNPLVAYGDSSLPIMVQMKYFAAGAWNSVGTGVSTGTSDVLVDLDLSVDLRGRPNIAWTEQDQGTSRTRLYAQRYSQSLP